MTGDVVGIYRLGIAQMRTQHPGAHANVYEDAMAEATRVCTAHIIYRNSNLPPITASMVVKKKTKED